LKIRDIHNLWILYKGKDTNNLLISKYRLSRWGNKMRGLGRMGRLRRLRRLGGLGGLGGLRRLADLEGWED
jgi:hypothetical protein